jgi:hypothetical protein
MSEIAWLGRAIRAGGCRIGAVFEVKKEIRSMRFVKISSLILSLAATLGVVPAFGATCSTASLNGVFGFIDAGYDSSGEHGASVGQITYDGKGKVTGAFTHSHTGTISTLTFKGTYSVAKNCTGSIVETQSNSVKQTNNFVIDNGDDGTQFILTDSGQIETGFSLAQGTGTCGLTGKAQTFAVSLIGPNAVLGPVAYVDQLILNGKGKISGSGSSSIAGSIHKGTITGTYTEAADCTGTLQFTPPGGNLSNFNFVVVNSGKELLAIETDSGTTVFGNSQQ